jgi:hypothetical protein
MFEVAEAVAAFGPAHADAEDGCSMLKIGIRPGDDIGLEGVPQAVKVMKAAAEKKRERTA